MPLSLPHDIAHHLAQHHVMTLATQGDDGPWAAALFYARDGDDLIFVSSPTSRHCRNLAQQPRCAATIQGEHTDWRSIQGVQIEGIAHETTGTELARAQSGYGIRFPFVQPAAAPTEIKLALERVRWYRLQMIRLYFIDNLRGMGQRQQFEV